jgi:hypothetical protein
MNIDGKLATSALGYCAPCEAFQTLHVTKACYRRKFGSVGAWAALRCGVCHFDIASIMLPVAGQYGLQRIRQVRALCDMSYMLVAWFYCAACSKMKPLGITEMDYNPEFPENGVWGQMVCSTCFAFVGAIRVERPGWYGILHLEDLPQSKSQSLLLNRTHTR